jgi:chromosome segregation ATPase
MSSTTSHIEDVDSSDTEFVQVDITTPATDMEAPKDEVTELQQTDDTNIDFPATEFVEVDIATPANDMEGLKNQIAELQKKGDSNKIQIKCISQHIFQMLAKVNDLQAQLSGCKSNSAEKGGQLKRCISTTELLRDRLHVNQDVSKTLDKDRDDWTSQVQKLKGEKDSLVQGNEQLLRDVEDEDKSIKKLKEEVKDWARMDRDFENFVREQFDLKDDEIKKLDEEKDMKEQEKMEEMEQEVEKIVNKDFDRYEKVVREEFDRREKLVNEDFDRLEGCIKKMEEEKEALTRETEREENRVLKVQFDDQKRGNRVNTLLLDAKQNECVKLSEQVDTLEGKVEQATKDLKQQFWDLLEDLELEIMEQVDQLDQDFEDLENENDELKREKDELKREKDELKKEKHELKEENEGLKWDLEVAETRITGAFGRFDEAKEHAQREKARAEAAEELNAENAHDIERLSIEIDNLQAANDKLKQGNEFTLHRTTPRHHGI